MDGGITAALDRPEAWPELELKAWRDTYETLHMWTQIVGKVALGLAPPVNHWWHCALTLTPTGLSTRLLPFEDRSLRIEFDMLRHNLLIEDSEGGFKALPLVARSVADFYAEMMASLAALGVEPRMRPVPDEVAHPIPFAEDRTHASYDPASVERFFRALRTVDTVFKAFRGRFVGKSSPVQFFWGTFDLSVSRFSGRRAPPRPDANSILRESYTHETISAGFWPGGGQVPGPAFFAYAAPEPTGLRERRILPPDAVYSAEMGEFLLMYDDVRRTPSPTRTLLDFLQSTYEAASQLAGWDRAALERTAPEEQTSEGAEAALH